MAFQEVHFSTIIIFFWGILFLSIFLYRYYSHISQLKKSYLLLLKNDSSFSQSLYLSACGIILLIALLGPSIYKTNQNIYQNGIEVVVILDVSKSMNAQDINDNWELYSRIDIAKTFIKKIVTEHPENKYGLVIFAWEAINISPLTHDSQIFLNFLSGVDYKNINIQWTNIEEAYARGIKRFSDEKKTGQLILFLSDWGDADDSTDLWKIKKILDNSYVSHSIIWIGTESWWKIINGQDIFWSIKYQQFNWKDVITKINRKKLQKIAKIKWWDYYEIKNTKDLWGLSDIFSQIETRSFQRSWWNSSKSISRHIAFWAFILFLLYISAPLFKRRK